MASTSFIQTFDRFTRTRPGIKPSSSSSSRSTRHTGLLRVVRAIKREARNHNSGGGVVDENMIILRRRIHEMKMIEADHELPREWMDWEKRVYESYDAIICDAVGHLQSYLMDTRPSLALGVVVLLALSVPTSTAVLMHNLFEIFSRIHLG